MKSIQVDHGVCGHTRVVILITMDDVADPFLVLVTAAGRAPKISFSCFCLARARAPSSAAANDDRIKFSENFLNMFNNGSMLIKHGAYAHGGRMVCEQTKASLEDEGELMRTENHKKKMRDGPKFSAPTIVVNLKSPRSSHQWMNAWVAVSVCELCACGQSGQPAPAIQNWREWIENENNIETISLQFRFEFFPFRSPNVLRSLSVSLKLNWSALMRKLVFCCFLRINIEHWQRKNWMASQKTNSRLPSAYQRLLGNLSRSLRASNIFFLLVICSSWMHRERCHIKVSLLNSQLNVSMPCEMRICVYCFGANNSFRHSFQFSVPKRAWAMPFPKPWTVSPTRTSHSHLNGTMYVLHFSSTHIVSMTQTNSKHTPDIHFLLSERDSFLGNCLNFSRPAQPAPNPAHASRFLWNSVWYTRKRQHIKLLIMLACVLCVGRLECKLSWNAFSIAFHKSWESFCVTAAAVTHKLSL